MSIRDISKIIKEEEARKQNHEDDSTEATGREDYQLELYDLFDRGKTPVEVVNKTRDCRTSQYTKLYKEYLKLQGLPEVVSLCDKIGDDAWSYLELYKLANSSGMSNKEIVTAVDIALNKLPSADRELFSDQEKSK